MNKIAMLAEGIRNYEGMDASACNPLALRWSPYETGHKCYAGRGCFATFATYEKGLEAGIHQLTIVANGTSPVYTAAARRMGLSSCSDMTIEQFMTVYSPSSDQNNPAAYAAFLSRETGFPESTTMGSLLQ